MDELDNSSKSRAKGATRNWRNSKTRKENVQPKEYELPVTPTNGCKDQRQSKMDEYVNAAKQPEADAANSKIKKE